MEEIDYNYLIMVRDYHLIKPRDKQLREPDGTILPLILIESEIWGMILNVGTASADTIEDLTN